MFIVLSFAMLLGTFDGLCWLSTTPPPPSPSHCKQLLESSSNHTNTSTKQRKLISNLENESQSGKFQELCFSKCACRNHQTVLWNCILSPKGLPASSAAEEKLIRASQLQKSAISSSPAWSPRQRSSLIRHISSVHRRLRESGLHGQAAVKKPLPREMDR